MLTPLSPDQWDAAKAAHLLNRAIAQAMAADPVEVAILRRFTSVAWQDSSVVMLPEAWAQNPRT